MRKRKFVRAVIILALFGVSAVFIIKLFNKEGAPPEIQNFSKEEAKRAAQASLASFEAWRGPEIRESYTFYDLESKPSAYLFNVTDNYGKAGYIVISASTKLDPVVEVSISEETPVTRIINLANEMAQGTIYKPQDIRSEYLYLGGSDYYTKLTLREGDEVIVKYYLVRKEGTQETDLEQVRSMSDFYSTYQDEDSQQKWDQILNE